MAEVAMRVIKQRWRARMRGALGLSASGGAAAPAGVGAVLAERVMELTEVRALPKGSAVLVFAPLPGEPDTGPLLDALRDAGHVTGLPVVEGGGLVFYAVEAGEDLPADRFGVPAPAASRRTADRQVHAPDAVVMPGLAFDPTTGTRLGRGGGYYDKYLSGPGLAAWRIGLGWDAQVVAGVPAERHDASVDVIITPTRTLRPTRRRG